MSEEIASEAVAWQRGQAPTSIGYEEKDPPVERVAVATFAQLRPAIPALTGLRFIAAGCVFVSHSIGFLLPLADSPDWFQYLRALAGIGMPLFLYCLVLLFTITTACR